MFNDEVYLTEYGSCAFVAGAIEVITGNLDVAMYNAGVRYEALAAELLEKAISNYCREIEYYLGILFDIVFVRFEEHLLMLLRGSAE